MPNKIWTPIGKRNHRPMTGYVQRETSLILDSGTAAGAVNKSADGSYFQVQFGEPLQIPENAVDCQIAVEEAEIWWTIPNIVTGVNDRFYVTDSSVPATYSLTIPQGLYDLTGLSQAILRELENAGAATGPALITLTPDEATQKVELRLNYATVSVDFTQSDTMRTILGFNSAVVGPGTAGETYLADNVAAFNTINYFLLHSDITNDGIRTNNDYSQTIAKVPIDVSPGSQIVYKPFNPARVEEPNLIGATRNSIQIWLTDQDNNRVNTNTEDYSLRLNIRYKMPVT